MGKIRSSPGKLTLDDEVIAWLLRGDVSIQYQVWRDLLEEKKDDLQTRITSEGWGRKFLATRNKNGHWGQAFYQPKWISTHYTLLDLRNLCIARDQPEIRDTIEMILAEEKGPDGGVRPIGSSQRSDVCINGMFLNYASYFCSDPEELESIVDFLLSEVMLDGGFNCMLNRSGAKHSSLHSTISVLEGITEYEKGGYTYRLKELRKAKKSSLAFILLHQLYISDRTGKIIRQEFLKFPYPTRWKYDILRALDYFQYENVPGDARMSPALGKLLAKRRHDSTWNLNAKYPGKVHFEMEKAGKPSRWNTLRAMRVLKCYTGLSTQVNPIS